MPEQKSALGRFFGFIWSTVLALYRLIVVVGVLVVLGLFWMGLRGGPAPKVEDNVALVLWPTGDLVDQLDTERRFIERFTADMPSQTRLQDLIEALDAAADDPRIAAVVLKLDSLSSAGMAQMEELIAAMRRFQASGKPIHAVSANFDQTGYLAAAAADDISIDPMGSVLLEGFSVYQNYFKDALDKLGVKVNVFRVGEFKAAVEPFIRNDMSEEARRANQEWLGDLWKDYGEGVAQARKLEEGAADRYVAGFRQGLEQGKGDAAAYAKRAGLVTHVESLAEFRKRVAEKVGIDDEHGSFRQINYAEYLRAVDHESSTGRGKRDADTDVALIVVQGEIVDGIGEPGQAGGDNIADLLEQARLDDKVAAVVLRIDSPGGSAWASEQIRREVQQLRASGKPVVASMGSVAASGGYWVAMDSDRIFAQDSTITGSIGIFGLIPTIDQPLGKLGIHTDGVGTTALAGAFRIDRPLSGDVAAIFQAEVDKGYRDFIEGVAAGRKLEVTKVESIAQGRVWSGSDAKSFGLIDAFGGLREAADAAAELAGLDMGEWSLEEFRDEPQFPAHLISQFFGLAMAQWSGAATVEHPLLSTLNQTEAAAWLRRFTRHQGVYAHCMCVPQTSSHMH